MRDPRRQNASFAGARAGENQNRPVKRLDGFALFGIKRGEVWGRPSGRACTRARSDAARLRRVLKFERLAGFVRRMRTCGGKAGQKGAPVPILSRIGPDPESALHSMWGFSAAMSPAYG
jgi:hypothetical protein